MRKVFVNVLTVSLALDRTNASTPALKTPPMLMESVITNDSCVKCKNGYAPNIEGKCALCPLNTVAGLGNEICIDINACEAIVGA